MAVNDLYQMRISLNGPGKAYQWHMAYKMISGTDYELALRDLCDKWKLDYEAGLKSLLTTQHEISQARADNVSNNSQIPGIAYFGNGQGTDADDAVPANMAAVIHILTDAPNAKFNGRIYFTGFGENAQINGKLAPMWQVALQNWADLLANNLTVTGTFTNEYKPVVISRYLDGVKRVTPVGYDWKAAVVRDIVHQQRRRTTDVLNVCN